MEHLFIISIYQDLNNLDSTKPKKITMDRKFELDKEINSNGIKYMAGLEFEALSKLIHSLRKNLFNYKKIFYIDVLYRVIYYHFVAVKATTVDKLNPLNKYFIFRAKKTDFLIKPKSDFVEKFKESKIEKKTDGKYFSVLNGTMYNEIQKVYSPIIYTGLKD